MHNHTRMRFRRVIAGAMIAGAATMAFSGLGAGIANAAPAKEPAPSPVNNCLNVGVNLLAGIGVAGTAQGVDNCAASAVHAY